MGTTYTHKEKNQTIKEFFTKEFAGNPVIGCMVKNRVAYLAVEYNDKTIRGVVCLLNYSPKQYHNFGYKDMSEDMGPYAYDCPKKILDLLTPTMNEEALKWRAKCQENLNKPKVKRGDKVRFSEPIRFQSGDVFTDFIFQRGSTFRAAGESVFDFFRITRWKERDFKIVT